MIIEHTARDGKAGADPKLGLLLALLYGPAVGLQAESNDLEKLVLRICIRPIHGAFVLLAIMDIRARSMSFASRRGRSAHFRWH